MVHPPLKPLIKICGLTDIAAIDAATGAGADMLGFVFFAKSPRHLEPDRAARLVAHFKAITARGLPGPGPGPDRRPEDRRPGDGRSGDGRSGAGRGGVRGGRGARGETGRDGRANAPALVGLFVNPRDDTLRSVLAHSPLDYIQLHGTEDPARVEAIRALTGLPVIKAIGIRTNDDIAAASLYAGSADMLLFDAKPPAKADRPGGLGARFDWDILAAYDGGCPFLLAGGLTVDSVAKAAAKTRNIAGFSGVDVSSGVESAPGKKDVRLIEGFIVRARDAMADCGDV